jgi:diguanylate cyclase (GGDEF)-like protein/PAS domain S-box-containing protein
VEIMRAGSAAALAFAGDEPWREVVRRVLETLAMAAGVDRGLLVRDDTEDEVIAAWTRPGAGEGAELRHSIPVIVGGERWGEIRLGEPAGGTWTTLELGGISSFAAIVASAVQRDRLILERREAESRLQAHIDNLPVVTYIEFTDEDHPLGYDEAYVSPQITTLLGYTQEEWVHDEDQAVWNETIHPDDRDLLNEEAARTARTGGPYAAEYRMRNKVTGEYVWVRDVANLVQGEGEIRPFWHGVMVDITERKRMEDQIAYLAYHDSLTGLANRKLFEELLEPALARARRDDTAVAVLFMDLDGFKEINDTLGHDVGDQLLQRVAERLREATRDTDLVARQGGDEFLVMVPDIAFGEPGEEPARDRSRAVQVAGALAERIQSLLSTPFAMGDRDVQPSISIGMSIFPFDAEDRLSLMRNADAAMYESKRTRPGGYALHPKLEGDALTRLSPSARLRRAVHDRPWVLRYQPIVDLVDGHRIGVEALLRWRRPAGNLLAPGEFLPLAGEMGLLEAIDDWVVEEICRQDAEWRAAGLELQLDVNLSPTQLWRRDLAAGLADTLAGAGVDLHRVVIELAESTSVAGQGRTQGVLASLRDRGLRVAIDDFGTGTSSPGRLRDLPVDIIKIDQPLVRDLPDDEDVAGFVGAVIGFAAGLGIETSAEGIETPQQRDLLVAQGCRYGQGYLFGRPVAGGQITA